MRMLTLPIVTVLFFSLACANSQRTPHEGVWSGTCSFPDDTYSYRLEMVDQEGVCVECEGDFPILDGYITVNKADGEQTLWGHWYHCMDPEGCVDSDGVAHPTDYVLWRAGATADQPDTLDTWFEGVVDPDDDERAHGDCVWITYGQPALQGAGSFTWEGKL